MNWLLSAPKDYASTRMKPIIHDGILRGGTAAIVRLLILAAAGISAYLLSLSLSGGIAVGCGPGSSCDEVLHSRWAYVLGIPVSALALLVDLMLLLATFAAGPKSSPKQRRGAWEIIVPCALLVVGAALWFVALQAFVLHRFCPWCMTAHACGAFAGIILLTRLPISADRPATGTRKLEKERDAALSRSRVLKLGVAAIIAIAMLGAAQLFFPGKAYSVAVIPNSGREVPTPNVQLNSSPTTLTSIQITAVAQSTATTSQAPAALMTNVSVHPLENSRILPVLGGRFALDLSQVPVWGSPDAPFKLVSLFDYTCHHCREMHPAVLEMQRSFGDKLAIVSLPMPLDSQCNPLMRVTPRPHVNACIYAKLGLMVWRANHAAIQRFDDWLFSFQNPPPLTEVTNKAVQLVGLLPFDAAARDPWVERQLRTDIDIYVTSARQFNQGSMPQFLVGTNIISGTLTAEQLHALVAKYVEPGSSTH